jgi:hypothetical protein
MVSFGGLDLKAGQVQVVNFNKKNNSNVFQSSRYGYCLAK